MLTKGSVIRTSNIYLYMLTMGLKLICHDDSQVASDSVERALLISAEGYTTLTAWAVGLQTSKKIAHRLRSISWRKEPFGWVIV